MAISHISGSDTGAQARSKMNEAIDKANLVDGKADQSALSAEASARQSGDTANSNAIAAEASARQTADATEAQARASGDAANAGAIAAEISARQAADAAETAARQAADAAETAARQAADAAETAARQAGDAIRASFADVSAGTIRPGEVAGFFTRDIDGAAADLDPIEADDQATGAGGRAGIVTGDAMLAPRGQWRVEPYRVYCVRFVVQRIVETEDPSNDAVRLALRWLKADKSAHSTTILVDLVDIVVASGRLEYMFNIALQDGHNVDFTMPAGAVYVRPFVRSFGDGVTHVEVIEVTDLTNGVDFAPDVSQFRRQIAGYDFRIEYLETHMEIAEANIEASRDAGWFVSGTLNDARLSENVMLRDAEQTVSGAKTFEAETVFEDAVRTRSTIDIGDGQATGDGATARMSGTINYFWIAPTDRAGDFVTAKEFGYDADTDDGVWTAKGGFKTTGNLTVTEDGDFGGAVNVVDKITTRANLEVYSTSEVDAIASDLQTAIDDEEDERIAADIILQGNIDAEETARIAGDLAIIDGAPANLDTLNKIAAAIEDDPAFATTIRAYVDGIVAAQDAMVFKGVIDCSGNPNYPAADRGWTYRVSVAGKIGGASGKVVEVGDIVICLTDGTATGDEATVGAQWAVIQTNIDGALTTASIGVAVQAYSAVLAAFVVLTPNTNDFLQFKSGAWAGRSPTQALADLQAVAGFDLWVAAPASASATGTAGQKAYDTNYLYICVATNTWRRIAHATW